jgi:type II secretory pathway component PulF
VNPLKALRHSSSRRAEFYELLGSFVADGIPLYNALLEIDQQYQANRHPMADISAMVLRRLRGDEPGIYSFGTALRGLVPTTEALAILGGEESGQTAAGIQRAAAICHDSDAILGTLRAELSYPLFLLLLFATLLVGISQEVVPTLAGILPVERWPASARMVARLADATPWLLGLGGLLLGGYALGFFLLRGNWTGPLRERLDAWIFPWNLHRRITGALLMTSLAALIRIGVPFSQALERLRDIGGPWEAEHIERIRNQLRLGVAEGRALASPLFDADIRWQIELYGRMTQFAEGLDKLSGRLVHATKQRISAAARLLRTLLLILIALTVVWMYGAFLSITLAARSVG